MLMIRKKLDAREVNPTGAFYDPDCDCVKQDLGGGSTPDAPGLDTRTSPVWQKPPVTADDPKCRSALNYVAQLQGFFSQVFGILEIATAAATGVSIILDAVEIAFPPGAPVDALALLALNIASGILGAGVTAVGDAFDTGAYDALKCAYDCNASDDGSMSPDGLAAMLAAFVGSPGGLAGDILTLIFALQGNVGVSNWGATGAATGDCDDCNCWPPYLEPFDTTLLYATIIGGDGVHLPPYIYDNLRPGTYINPNTCHAASIGLGIGGVRNELESPPGSEKLMVCLFDWGAETTYTAVDLSLFISGGGHLWSWATYDGAGTEIEHQDVEGTGGGSGCLNVTDAFTSGARYFAVSFVCDSTDDMELTYASFT